MPADGQRRPHLGGYAWRRGLTASIFFALASGDPRPIHFFWVGWGLSLGTPDRFIFPYPPWLGGDPRPIEPAAGVGASRGTARGARRAGNVGGGRGLALRGGRTGAEGWGGWPLGAWGGAASTLAGGASGRRGSAGYRPPSSVEAARTPPACRLIPPQGSLQPNPPQAPSSQPNPPALCTRAPESPRNASPLP